MSSFQYHREMKKTSLGCLLLVTHIILIYAMIITHDIKYCREMIEEIMHKL